MRTSPSPPQTPPTSTALHATRLTLTITGGDVPGFVSVTGQLLDLETGEGIGLATITFHHPGLGLLLGSAVTDNNGNYSTSISLRPTSLHIVEARYAGGGLAAASVVGAVPGT